MLFFVLLIIYHLCRHSWVTSFSINSYTTNITTQISTYETLESEDLNKEAQHFLNPIYRDIDPSNDVERIDLQQWPGRSTVLLPRNEIPSTTNVMVPNKFFNVSVSSQRNSTRYVIIQ